MPLEKGTKIGKKFSKDYQPPKENVGRKPKLPELDVLLAKVLGAEQGGMTAAEVLLLALHQQALSGNTRAAEVLLNRGYGMPKQDMNLRATVQSSTLTPEQFAQFIEEAKKDA